MDITSFEAFLVLIVLILTGITLFLCVVNAIYLSKIYQQLCLSKSSDTPAARTRQRVIQTPVPPVAESPSPVPTAVSRPQVTPVADVSKDIPDGIKRICEKYALESLVISTPDGLLVTSYGATSAETEAAEYSQQYAKGKDTVNPLLSITGLTHRGTALICIMKSQMKLNGGEVSQIREELELLLNRWI